MKYRKRRLREEETGIEISPKKNGDGLEVKAVRSKGYSQATTKGKGADYTDQKMLITEPTKTQKDLAKATYKALKAKGKEKDISKKFNIEPRPDIKILSDGDVKITPDNGKDSYIVPEREIEKYTESRIIRRGSSNEKFDDCSISKLSEIVDRLLTDEFSATIEKYTDGPCIHVKTTLDPKVTIDVYPLRFGYEIERFSAPSYDTTDLWRGYNLQEFTQDFGECVQEVINSDVSDNFLKEDIRGDVEVYRGPIRKYLRETSVVASDEFCIQVRRPGKQNWTTVNSNGTPGGGSPKTFDSKKKAKASDLYKKFDNNPDWEVRITNNTDE